MDSQQIHGPRVPSSANKTLLPYNYFRTECTESFSFERTAALACQTAGLLKNTAKQIKYEFCVHKPKGIFRGRARSIETLTH